MIPDKLEMLSKIWVNFVSFTVMESVCIFDLWFNFGRALDTALFFFFSEQLWVVLGAKENWFFYDKAVLAVSLLLS